VGGVLIRKGEVFKGGIHEKASCRGTQAGLKLSKGGRGGGEIPVEEVGDQ